LKILNQAKFSRTSFDDVTLLNFEDLNDFLRQIFNRETINALVFDVSTF